MRNELRKIFTIWALEFAFWITPEGVFKDKLCLFLRDNIMKL